MFAAGKYLSVVGRIFSTSKAVTNNSVKMHDMKGFHLFHSEKLDR